MCCVRRSLAVRATTGARLLVCSMGWRRTHSMFVKTTVESKTYTYMKYTASGVDDTVKQMKPASLPSVDSKRKIRIFSIDSKSVSGSIVQSPARPSGSVLKPYGCHE